MPALDGAAVAVGKGIPVAVLGPRRAPLIGAGGAGGPENGIDGRAAEDERMGAGGTAVVAERGVEDGGEGSAGTTSLAPSVNPAIPG